MLNFSVKTWIPANLNNEELIQQFADSVDWLLSVDFPNSDKLAERFESIKGKYQNLNDVPLEDIYAIINESGYSYITNTLDLDESSLRTFVSFLNFIHMNKGTKKGLEFVFSLLKMDYKITEWFETVPVGEPMTFSLDLSFSVDNISNDVITRIENFISNYVYPVISYLLIELKLDLCSIKCGGAFQSTGDFTFYPAIPTGSTLIWGQGLWNAYNWD